MQNKIKLVSIEPPPIEQHVKREASLPTKGEKRNRYHLPLSLESQSPIGYRTRLSLSKKEASEAEFLFSMNPPTQFSSPSAISEQALFEESSLGIMSSRQSTNFQGHRQYTFGQEKSIQIAEILKTMEGLEGPVLDNVSYTHIVLNHPYRTPFTLLLTFVGHKPLSSLATVPIRGWKKRYSYIDDIPTIGYLPHLHLGILADGLERAVVLASEGTRQANIFMGPFCSQKRIQSNRKGIEKLEDLIGLSRADRMSGWRVRMVAQVCTIPTPFPISKQTCRKIAANSLSFRS